MDVSDLWRLTSAELYETVGWTLQTKLEDMAGPQTVNYFELYLAHPKFKDKNVMDCSQDPLRSEGVPRELGHGSE